MTLPEPIMGYRWHGAPILDDHFPLQRGFHVFPFLSDYFRGVLSGVPDVKFFMKGPTSEPVGRLVGLVFFQSSPTAGSSSHPFSLSEP